MMVSVGKTPVQTKLAEITDDFVCFRTFVKYGKVFGSTGLKDLANHPKTFALCAFLMDKTAKITKDLVDQFNSNLTEFKAHLAILMKDSDAMRQIAVIAEEKMVSNSMITKAFSNDFDGIFMQVCGAFTVKKYTKETMAVQVRKAIEMLKTDKIEGITLPTEAKPAETASAEAKPAETASAETAPTVVKPAETVSAEVKPAETKPVDEISQMYATYMRIPVENRVAVKSHLRTLLMLFTQICIRTEDSCCDRNLATLPRGLHQRPGLHGYHRVFGYGARRRTSSLM